MNKNKILKKLLGGSKNIRFAELVSIARFGLSTKTYLGSHHIFQHQDIPELLDLQDCNGQAEPYQVEQLPALVEQYNLPYKETR